MRQAILAAGDVDAVEVGDESAPEPRAGAAPGAADAAQRTRQIRVDLRRLDALMNQVGELVVAKGRLAELVARDASPELQAVGSRIARVVAEMQTEIIQARMTPVWQVFDRFPRVVRDLSRQLGKRVAFEVEGEEIELDRALLDELGEPLLHLLRNAVDHGIESPADRKKHKKSAEAQHPADGEPGPIQRRHPGRGRRAGHRPRQGAQEGQGRGRGRRQHHRAER